MTMDHYSYLITFQVFRKTADLLIKNSSMRHDHVLNEVARI